MTHYYRLNLHTPDVPAERVPFDTTRPQFVFGPHFRREALELINRWNAQAPNGNWKYWLAED